MELSEARAILRLTDDIQFVLIESPYQGEDTDTIG